MTLSTESCKPCKGEEARLSSDDVQALLKEVDGWLSQEMDRKIIKDFKFKNFKQAQAFVNQVGGLAEQQGHHPDISFGWGYAEITLTTHATGGLSRNDFILAAKIDGLVQA